MASVNYENLVRWASWPSGKQIKHVSYGKTVPTNEEQIYDRKVNHLLSIMRDRAAWFSVSLDITQTLLDMLHDYWPTLKI